MRDLDGNFIKTKEAITLVVNRATNYWTKDSTTFTNINIEDDVNR